MMLGDEDRPLTGWRALRSPEYWLLLVGCLAAGAGVGAMLVVPLLVAGLSISSLPKHIASWPRARRADAEREWCQTVVSSIFNNLATACVTFLLGIVARWQWL